MEVIVEVGGCFVVAVLQMTMVCHHFLGGVANKLYTSSCDCQLYAIK